MTTGFLLLRVDKVRTGGDTSVSGHLCDDEVSVYIQDRREVLLFSVVIHHHHHHPHHHHHHHHTWIYRNKIPKVSARWQKPHTHAFSSFTFMAKHPEKCYQTEAHPLEHCYNHFSFLYYKLFTT